MPLNQSFDKPVWNLVARAMLMDIANEQMPEPIYRNLYSKPRLRGSVLRFTQRIHGQVQQHMIFNEN